MTDEISYISDLSVRARKLILAEIYAAGSGHPGGCLSAVDLIGIIYQKIQSEQRITQEPSSKSRFILSKGHAAPALYAIGALYGLCPLQELRYLRKLGSPYQGHPHIGTLPWVETSTGSLGQGFSVAMGMALGQKFKGNSSNIFCLLGDGEMQEGEVWETLMAAAHYKLENLCAILDYNKLQSDDFNSNVMGLEPLTDKVRSFGWEVDEIDGHDFSQLSKSIIKKHHEKPRFIIAHTIKGKGVSFMENNPAWHGSVKISEIDFQRALKELGSDEIEISRYLKGDFDHE